jgi:hypothetical protein
VAIFGIAKLDWERENRIYAGLGSDAYQILYLLGKFGAAEVFRTPKRTANGNSAYRLLLEITRIIIFLPLISRT